jgi:hypothetical protein
MKHNCPHCGISLRWRFVPMKACEGQRKILPLHADFVCPNCNGRMKLAGIKTRQVKLTKFDFALKILTISIMAIAIFTKDRHFLYAFLALSVFDLIKARKSNKDFSDHKNKQKFIKHQDLFGDRSNPTVNTD